MKRVIRGARRRPAIALFILPMIDVIFLLLLFFVVVTSFEAGAKVRVDVPHPEKSRARAANTANQVVLNCEYISASEGRPTDAAYRLGGDPPAPLSVIADRLAAARAANVEATVLIRADRRLSNEKVADAIRVATAQGFPRIEVAAKKDEL